jgi:hypothetical protein
VVKTIVACIYMAIWGIATIIVVIKDDSVPPEYWSLPAVGLGAVLAAVNTIEKRAKGKPDVEPDDDEATEENA